MYTKNYASSDPINQYLNFFLVCYLFFMAEKYRVNPSKKTPCFSHRCQIFWFGMPAPAMLVGDGATAGATATPVPGLIVLPLFLAPDEEMFIARALLGDRAAEIVPECAEIGENGAKMDENGAKMTENGGELDENGRARPRYPPKRGGKIKKKGQAAFVPIGLFLLSLLAPIGFEYFCLSLSSLNESAKP
jgi:hypothetical protein